MIKKFIEKIVPKLIPYYHTTGYMERFWLVPYAKARVDRPGTGPIAFTKNPFAWTFQQFEISARLHHILRSDNDRAFHDHPRSYIAVILTGGYWEWTRRYMGLLYLGEYRKWYGPGSIIMRSANHQHKLELPEGMTTWTLFITGKTIQQWGFFPYPWSEKIHWKKYLGVEDEAVNYSELIPVGHDEKFPD